MTTQTTELIKTGSPNAPQMFMQMLTGFWVFQTIYVVAKLGIADQLKKGPQSVTALAKKVGANEDYLYRVMRALACMGIFWESEDRMFDLTPMAELLCSDSPNSMHPVVIMLGEENCKAWEQLYPAMQSDGFPFEMAHGLHAFEYFEKNPTAGETFNAAMTALVRNDQALIAEIYNFSDINCVVDVGGGHGMLLAAILKRYPNVSGVLFDLPQVVSEARELLKNEDIEARCRTAGGDFFESVIQGGDLYILSHVVHGFSDALSEKILYNICNAMPAHGKLLLIEDVLIPGQDPSTIKTKLMDLNMLVMTPGGRERTSAEFNHMLDSTGFQLTQIIPTPGSTAIIEAVKR
jgi:hypothetical protein